MPYLVYVQTNGKRAWFVDTEHRLDKYSQPYYFPLFDDTDSKVVSLEFAHEARDRWLKDFSLVVHVALERDGAFIDENRGIPTTGHDVRKSQFVSFTNGLGLLVVPGTTPAAGPVWFVRAQDIPAFAVDGRYTTIESVVGNTPEETAQRAYDTWGSQILFEDPARVIAEEEQQQKSNFVAGIRPGDR